MCMTSGWAFPLHPTTRGSMDCDGPFPLVVQLHRSPHSPEELRLVSLRYVFHVFAHVKADHIVCRAKELDRQLFRQLGLPTPVGPTKRKLPIGRLGDPRPTRLRRMAFAILSTASS